LGDSSYTLYLSHLIIIELFYLVGLRGFFTGSEYKAIFGLVLITLISVVFSLIYYKFIEKPVYKKALKYGENI
jgi:peptidoglycan/LPS O-acetylase OafA/YrhL